MKTPPKILGIPIELKIKLLSNIPQILLTKDESYQNDMHETTLPKIPTPKKTVGSIAKFVEDPAEIAPASVTYMS